MIRRSTLVLVIIFVVLAAFTLYWQRSGFGEEDQAPTSTPQVKLIDQEADSIQSIRIQDASGKAAQYDKQPDGSWAYMVEPLQTAKPEEIVQVINQVVGLRAVNTLESPPAPSAIGFDPAAYQVELKAEGGQNLLLEIGAATVTGSGYYIRTGGKIYVVNKSAIDQTIEVLNTPPILTPVPTITSTPEGTATP